MKMPKTATIDGIILEVPQDMYITKDRKRFEEKKASMQSDILKRLLDAAMGQERKKKPLPRFPDYGPMPWKTGPDKTWWWDWKVETTAKGKKSRIWIEKEKRPES